MKTPHFRLDTLCILVLMTALNLAWYHDSVRHGHFVSHSVFGFADRGYDGAALPMISSLTIGLYLIIFRQGRPSAFLLGFETCGLITTLAFMVWIWVAPASESHTIIGPFSPWLRRPHGRHRLSTHEILLACSIISSSPQFLAALLGGWLAQRMADRRASSFTPPSR